MLNIQFVGAPEDLSDERKASLADLIESVQAGVVQITTSGGSGSGFILTADGLVVTNEHVVAGANTVGVWLTSGRRYDGEVLERDAAADLALVRIDSGDSFDPIPVGNPDAVRMGDEVLALGFPIADRIGNSMTVTRGIVSSIRTAQGVDPAPDRRGVEPGQQRGPTHQRRRRGDRRQHLQDRGYRRRQAGEQHRLCRLRHRAGAQAARAQRTPNHRPRHPNAHSDHNAYPNPDTHPNSDTNADDNPYSHD